MKRNVGSADRWLRGIGGLAMGIGAVVAPVPTAAAVAIALAGFGLLLTALSSTCPGYWLLGRSSCPLEAE